VKGETFSLSTKITNPTLRRPIMAHAYIYNFNPVAGSGQVYVTKEEVYSYRLVTDDDLEDGRMDDLREDGHPYFWCEAHQITLTRDEIALVEAAEKAARAARQLLNRKVREAEKSQAPTQ
jgi:hypothetical protein